jgi:hypothetical protein
MISFRIVKYSKVVKPSTRAKINVASTPFRQA